MALRYDVELFEMGDKHRKDSETLIGVDHKEDSRHGLFPLQIRQECEKRVQLISIFN